MIINALKEAGRYEEVTAILKDIIMSNGSDYPVDVFIDKNGEPKTRINGSSLRLEASRLLNIINGKEIIKPGDITIRDIENLHNYVKTETDMWLHNYANLISHRRTPTDDSIISMDEIRNWQILNNLIYCMYIEDDEDYDVNTSWKVSKGWWKLEEEPEQKESNPSIDKGKEEPLVLISQKELHNRILKCITSDEINKFVDNSVYSDNAMARQAITFGMCIASMLSSDCQTYLFKQKKEDRYDNR